MKTETAPTDKAAPETIYLKNYQAPDYLIGHVALTFCLDPKRTIVKSALQVKRNDAATAQTPLILNGEDLELLSVKINGTPISADAYTLSQTHLSLPNVPADFILEIEVAVQPEANTKLSGLYMSNGMFCTQCEAEGFRRITYYLDRPDILATFDVRIEADKAAYPVLLSNGNPGDTGTLDAQQHFAEWSDPHPKPAYLFALVGGDLAQVEDRFTTQSGRDVTLRVFVQPENKDKCDYTLDALKRSMAWDEQVFGREYDLDIFMIVAVDHFNFGAMENKGLNIFNSAYVLASPETATDRDYELIEGIVAHEYFHNWSGNRVTCRDWFQLCLKEGFTVFRDQEFSADMRVRSVQRIKDVNQLLARQFPEDAGPLAHPARPESYITIDNFYTATVYEKGAEIVRMMKTLIGAEDFRKATDLYFERHDGEAATVEDFVVAMEEASGRDLTQFRRWYSDAGTPTVAFTESFTDDTYTLTATQHTNPTPGQAEKLPRHIPIVVGLLDATGEIVPSQTYELTQEHETLTFKGLAEKPVASVARGFSAPITIHQDLSVQDRLTVINYDTDDFNRWRTARRFAIDLLKTFAGEPCIENPDQALENYIKALGTIAQDNNLSPAFRAEILAMPSATDLARAVTVIDPTAIHQARQKLRSSLSTTLQETLLALYHHHQSNAAYSPAAEQAGERGLKNTALGLLMAGTSTAAPSSIAKDLALSQAHTATNMTDEAAAVSLIALSNIAERETVLESFYQKWAHETLVINKWLAWQAMSPAPTALGAIKTLTTHPAFDLKTPNKVRSLIGAFAMENLSAFHQEDGAGYAFFFKMIRALDPINPQVAARLLTATESWRKLEPGRKAKLESALKNLAGETGLSDNVYEMAERLIG